MNSDWKRIYPAVFVWEIGKRTGITPQEVLGGRERGKQLRQHEEMPLPSQAAQLYGEVRKEGVLVRIPSRDGERYYGLGLQMFSFLQNGKRKRLSANADAVADTGDSHAPVPFFISSQGYGILIDSARTVEVDFGCGVRVRDGKKALTVQDAGCVTEELYEEKQRGSEVTIFVKGVAGLRLHCFAGGSVTGAVEQYNLFCGGGCLPPLWGLGNLYRCYTRADQEQAEQLMEEFVREKMPFSMIGLEPGWHSHSYSCSFSWNEEKFPDPDRLLRLAEEKRVKINLWEQPYVHPAAAFYEEIIPVSGDYEVWDGAAPDFALQKARDIYGKRQEELFSQGVGAVKLDECDGSDYTGSWFFPDYARFPSGLTGEEEKNMYGAMAVRVVQDSFERLGRRTYSQVRANYSYGAPMPYVLYSDLYDHRQFVRALCNAGLSGLLWSPEVRQCGSAEELLRRMETVVFSPLSVINAWMIPNPPWKQFDREKNLRGELLEDESLQNEVRKLLKLRNRLVPYLYTAFYRYEKYGTPPFRPLVMDFPKEEQVWEIDDCYMMGDSLLVAPVFTDSGDDGRRVYLPEGKWYDFWKDTCYEGGREYMIKTDSIPVFVRDNSLLPLAVTGEAPAGDRVFSLEVRAYGKEPCPFMLVEDDGESFDYRSGKQRCISLTVKEGNWQMPDSDRYKIDSIVRREWKGDGTQRYRHDGYGQNT